MHLFNGLFHLYGFLIGLGITAAVSASAWLAKRRGNDTGLIWDGAWWVLVPALIGARLYHVADLWNEVYAGDFWSIISVWNGGLGIIGAMLGGFIGLCLYWFYVVRSKAKLLGFPALADVVMFGLPLGQSIGRLGNWANQEVYGLPTLLPWAVYIDPQRRLDGYQQFDTFHPLFAYEALWAISGFLIMLYSEVSSGNAASNKQLSQIAGKINKSFAGFYLVWYGSGRFILEFLRPQEFIWQLGPFNMAQIMSAIFVLTGAWLLCGRRYFSTTSTE